MIFSFSNDFELLVRFGVLSMKLVNIMLSKLLLFHERVQHDGYENIHAFVCDRREKILR